MDSRQLAKMVLRVLDLQREYFTTKATEKLHECKRAEGELRKVCAEVIHPPQRAPTLFEQIDADAGQLARGRNAGHNRE